MGSSKNLSRRRAPLRPLRSRSSPEHVDEIFERLKDLMFRAKRIEPMEAMQALSAELQGEGIEDYTEAQLREWLQGFGRPEAVVFLKDPGSTELNGKGYVRFASHEEAVGLLVAFAEDDEEGKNPQVLKISED
eukprot:Skav209464  [mRNA]  locus=scaffold3498:78551:80362:+ [translate_table: standard]